MPDQIGKPPSSNSFLDEAVKEQAKSKGLKLMGKVKSAHGIRGELYILVFAGEVDWLSKLKVLELYQYKIPREVQDTAPSNRGWLRFDLVSARVHKGGFIAKSSQIKDRNAAEELKGSYFYIPADFLITNPGEKIYLSEIEGFSVVELNKGYLGKIEGFSSNGVQDLLVLKDAMGRKEGEILIPLVSEFVVEILFERRELIMKLPEGLVEDLSKK
ncbi:MAG: 16S rRNA processing protein RimM [Bdellovibrionales bacterium]|nr:16S rRNA processing protein RimM [Bdellovibrionales bacterium]